MKINENVKWLRKRPRKRKGPIIADTWDPCHHRTYLSEQTHHSQRYTTSLLFSSASASASLLPSLASSLKTPLNPSLWSCSFFFCDWFQWMVVVEEECVQVGRCPLCPKRTTWWCPLRFLHTQMKQSLSWVLDWALVVVVVVSSLKNRGGLSMEGSWLLRTFLLQFHLHLHPLLHWAELIEQQLVPREELIPWQLPIMAGMMLFPSCLNT